MCASQWSGHIERAAGSAVFDDALWWVHAYTKRRDLWRIPEIRDTWAVQIDDPTELDADDLEEREVDLVRFAAPISSIGQGGWSAF